MYFFFATLHADTGLYVPLFKWKSYALLLKTVREFNEQFSLQIRLTPHSLRAGGATYLKLMGHPLSNIMDIGRWSDVSTARSYVDLVFALQPNTILQEARVWPTHLGALNHLLVPL